MTRWIQGLYMGTLQQCGGCGLRRAVLTAAMCVEPWAGEMRRMRVHELCCGMGMLAAESLPCVLATWLATMLRAACTSSPDTLEAKPAHTRPRALAAHPVSHSHAHSIHN